MFHRKNRFERRTIYRKTDITVVEIGHLRHKPFFHDYGFSVSESGDFAVWWSWVTVCGYCFASRSHLNLGDPASWPESCFTERFKIANVRRLLPQI